MNMTCRFSLRCNASNSMCPQPATGVYWPPASFGRYEATVTVTSPQLQVGQLVQVSDSAGSYKFVDLPAGTYRLRAELTGFSSSIREDLRLTVGFNARIDLTLKLGAMEESVTVTGQSPVVDITSTTASV